jgi:PKD repeat protein
VGAVTLGLVVAALTATAASAHPPLVPGAQWLASQQTPAGGFPITLGQPVDPLGQGAVARGVLAPAYVLARPDFLEPATRNGAFLVDSYPRTFPNGSPDISPLDPLFLEELALVTGDPRYSDFLQANLWNKLATGTYGAAGDQTAAEWALVMPELPAYVTWTSLKPLYRAQVAVAAHFAGEQATRDAMMADLHRTLNNASGTDKRADLTGLAAAVWASALTGINLDPTAGRWRTLNNTGQFVTTLVGYQRPGGDWPYDTSNMASTRPGDVSVTSWAVNALKAWNADTYAANIESGLAFVASMQEPNGQILTSPGYPPTAATGVIVHADALVAFALDKGTIFATSGGGGGPTPPVAGFAASPLTGTAPLTVSFTDQSSGAPASWSWDFENDGVVDSTAQNPQFTYTTPGTYTVKLTVTNGQGADDEVQVDLITVNEPNPVATFLPVADTYVVSTARARNFGLETTLRSRDTARIYLTFTVTGTPGPSRAILRLFVSSPTADLVTVSAVPVTSWSETSLTWNNAPALGTALASGPAATKGWIELDLGTIPGDGTYSYALTNPTADAVYFNSRETASSPELSVSPA